MLRTGFLSTGKRIFPKDDAGNNNSDALDSRKVHSYLQQNKYILTISAD